MSHNPDQSADNPQSLRRIAEALAGMEFGSVEITVHNSRIVQIERREKVRFGASKVSTAAAK